jgi:hypothetical protein
MPDVFKILTADEIDALEREVTRAARSGSPSGRLPSAAPMRTIPD